MSTENKNNPKSRIGYGVKIPKLSFLEVIELTKITGNKAGEEGSLDALSRITGNSRSSSSFNKKVAALKNFGVFNIDKSGYSLTELGKQIVNPESFEKQAKAIIEAFLNLENLRKIWENYKGKRLPQIEFLANSIVNIIKIPPELKKTWAKYFIESANFAGLLDERESGSFQVLSEYTPSFADDKELEQPTKQELETTEKKQEQTIENDNIDPLGISNQSWGIFNTKTISNSRKAIFAIPENLTQQDIDSLKIFLKGIEVQLDGLKKSDE
ncbi:MAG: hypothetical protein IH852_14250 [Bacteroidetes bacterium]|nr:hypothetical protein [Bacteroidota bacterium]